MRRYILVFALCSLFLTPLAAQTVISGQVRDAMSRQAMDYVDVILMEEGQTLPVEGAVTDENGLFDLTAPKNGKYTLLIPY